MELTYKQMGDYLIPDFVMDDEKSDKMIIGRFGQYRKTYLMNEKPALFNAMLLSGELTPHLIEVDTQAKEQLELIISQAMIQQGITENLKAADQMAWVHAVNNIKAQAEAFIFSQL